MVLLLLVMSLLCSLRGCSGVSDVGDGSGWKVKVSEEKCSGKELEWLCGSIADNNISAVSAFLMDLERRSIPKHAVLNYQTCVDDSTALNATPVKYTLLMEACRRGHLEITMKLLDVEGIDVNMRDSHGRSALHHVVSSNNTALLESFLQLNSVEVNVQDNDDISPVMYAIELGTPSMVEMFWTTPRVFIDQQRALHAAARSKDTNVMELLVKAFRVDVNIQDEDSGDTVLMAAIKCNNSNMVETLLNARGVDKNLPDNSGFSPLMHAIEVGNEDTVDMFLRSEDVILNGPSILMHAASRCTNTYLMEKLLILFDVDLTLQDLEGQTVLTHAVKGSNVIMVEFFLRINLGDANWRDKNDKTPLDYAVASANRDIVDYFLVASRVDVNIRDKDGYTPILRAFEYGTSEIANCFWKSDRVDVNVQEALHAAARNPDVRIMDLLLNVYRVNVNLQDSREGETALMMATRHNNFAVVELLLKSPNVKVNLHNHGTGENALTIAVANQNNAIVELLLNVGGMTVTQHNTLSGEE